MAKYQRVDVVPNAQISYAALRLYKLCDDKDLTIREIMRFFDWARCRTKDEAAQPKEPEFKSERDREAYEAWKEDMETFIAAYWDKCTVAASNRNGTNGQPVVDRWSTNKTINQPTRNTSIYLPNKPTLEEVRQECKVKGYGISPEGFYNEMTKQGWMDRNGSEIKDWKAFLGSWARSTRSTKLVHAQDYEQRTYTEEELDKLIPNVVLEALEKNDNKK